jgi:transcriptional regulator with XRE-family HTH domain
LQQLGKRLRVLRNDHGLTLARLGQQAGFSASYLSQVERGVTTPSLSTLTAIAGALQVDVRYFFEEDSSPPCVVRSNCGQKIGDRAGTLVELLSADPSDKMIRPYRVVYQPGASYEQPTAETGEECGFVVKGQMTVTVGEEAFVLHAGDSIHLHRRQPHSWRNEGDQECILIWAVSPPPPEAELEGWAAHSERR